MAMVCTRTVHELRRVQSDAHLLCCPISADGCARLEADRVGDVLGVVHVLGSVVEHGHVRARKDRLSAK